jgi:hypothetical protein
MNEILAAVIGGVFSVAAACLTWLLSRRPPEIGGFADVPPQRIEGVHGTWVGTLLQPEYPGGPVKARLEMRLQVKRGTIVGTIEARVEFDPEAHGISYKIALELKVRGGFYSDSLVKLDYRNTTPGVLQFGTLVMRVNARSSRMSGRLVGYGSYAEQVIYGTVDLEKTSQAA